MKGKIVYLGDYVNNSWLKSIEKQDNWTPENIETVQRAWGFFGDELRKLNKDE